MNDHASKRRQGAASEAPRLVLRAVLRGLGVYRIRGLDRLDVVVISPGGVGSTLLIDQLAPHRRVNSYVELVGKRVQRSIVGVDGG